MKKLIAIAVCVMMIASALVVSTSAAGEILFTDDFNNGFTANNWILEGNLYFLDDSGDTPCLSAYSDGVICQAEYRAEHNGSPRWYTNCDYSVRMKANDFDRDGDHSMGLWWRDDFNHTPDGEERPWELGEVYGLDLDLDNMVLQINVEGSEEPIATAPVSGVEVGGDWFTLGWRVTPGHMNGYVNGEKLIDIDIPDLSAQHPSPFLLKNGGMYASYDDVVIATTDYGLFGDADDNSDAEVTTTAGNADVTTTTAPRVTTTSQKVVEVTNDKGETVTDDSGKAVTSISVVTEAPAPADTNTGKPSGGSSSSTGDATFVVIAAMVATLGCAVIVRKASVK